MKTFKHMLFAVAAVAAACTPANPPPQALSERVDQTVSSFGRPEIFKALIANDYAAIAPMGLEAYTYIVSTNEMLEDPSAYFRAPEITTEIDPRVGAWLAQKAMTNAAYMNEAIESGMNQVRHILVTSFEPGSENDSLGERVADVNKAMIEGPGLKLGGATKLGHQDGVRLLQLLNTDPEAFREIYGAIQTYAQTY